MTISPTDTSSRLAKLREQLKTHNVHAFIVPSEDAHQSEYLAPCDARRSYISGFTGSAGLAVVTTDRAALWTDGRYYLQASQQLDSNWELQKAGLPDVPSKEEWLVKVLAKGSRVAIDPEVISIGKELNGWLVIQRQFVMASLPFFWEAIIVMDLAGKPFEEKIAELQDKLRKEQCWGVAVTALDEIAWLFNLRGSDIQYNPVFFSYALVTTEHAYLYVDDCKVTDAVKTHFGSKVTVKPYNYFFDHLKAFKTEKMDTDLTEVDGFIFVQVLTSKAIKTEAELEGFRQSHIRDAAALCRYFAWLENELVNKKSCITEADGADVLEKFRSELPNFVGLSFDTISSTGPNGAIIHYKPEHGSCANIDVNQLYLCDSGAQFLDGNDRCHCTLHFGTPSAREKDAFTRVLQGHINIDTAVFPVGTTGYILDIVARMPLWRAGLDFRHGTGHGVGSLSQQPGYYEDGAFGIRIENVLLVKKIETPNRFGDRDYLGFEHVTVAPIQTKLVDVNQISAEERGNGSMPTTKSALR
ncbi:hypothetical protein BSLG_002499, partial [Batrachochytrium salamandrivorans]